MIMTGSDWLSYVGAFDLKFAGRSSLTVPPNVPLVMVVSPSGRTPDGMEDTPHSISAPVATASPTAVALIP